MRLDVGVLLLCRPVLALEDVVASSPGVRRIPGLGLYAVHDVVLNVEDTLGIGLVVYYRCPITHSLLRVQNVGQYLVLYLNEPQRSASQLRRIGRSDCNAVTDVADLVVEDDLIEGWRLRVALPTRGVLDARDVVMCQHCTDAGKRSGPGGVNALDACVGVWAREQRTVEHPLESDVSGEYRAPGRELHAVYLDIGPPHDMEWLHVWR